MASAIDPSKPADGVPAVKADLRANLLAAKNEIEALQTIAAASVKQFGAAGDGVTDDTAAIQAAIDATSAAGGGMVFFPAGVYVISASINFKANVTCEGEFGGTMIEMADNANLNGIFVSSGAIPFFGLRNMILNGNRSGQSGFPGTSVGLRLAHATTSPAFGGNSLIDSGNEINDPYARFENLIIVAVARSGAREGPRIGKSIEGPRRPAHRRTRIPAAGRRLSERRRRAPLAREGSICRENARSGRVAGEARSFDRFSDPGPLARAGARLDRPHNPQPQVQRDRCRHHDISAVSTNIVESQALILRNRKML
jgi:Pectate lyase superfamily protein